MIKGFIDYKKLIALSKSNRISMHSNERTLLLENLEDVINTQLHIVNITGLSTLILVASNAKISSPEYWKILGQEVIKKAKYANSTNIDTLSVILFNYVNYFSMMPSEFYDALEKKILNGINQLSPRSLSQIIWSFAKINKITEKSSLAYERRSIEKMKDMNVLDLGHICISLQNDSIFGNNRQFIDMLCQIILERKGEMALKNHIFIGKGLASRNIYLEEYFTFLANKYEKDTDELTPYTVQELGLILSSFGKGLEISFLEKVHEIRILENRVSQHHLF